MYFSQDYLIRQIEIISRYIAEVVFHRKNRDFSLTAENHYESRNNNDDFLYLYSLIDKGEIDFAENILYEKIENNKSLDILELGLDFYSYLNSKSEEFLETNNFSRQEIFDGIKDLQDKFGLEGLL